MDRVMPILFNTGMTEAILGGPEDGHKARGEI